MKFHISKLFILIIFLCGLVGCDKKVSDTPSIAIQTTKPSGEVLLLTGDEINFDVTVLTRHAPEGSSVGVIIQASDDALLGIAEPIQVKNGQEIKLSAKAVIPATTSINIYAALYGNVNKDSIAVDSRAFRVIGVKR